MNEIEIEVNHVRSAGVTTLSSALGCDRADVDGVTDWAARIRKAVG